MVQSNPRNKLKLGTSFVCIHLTMENTADSRKPTVTVEVKLN